MASRYRYKIGKEDLKHWDGVASTFTRSTTTGGSQTLDKCDYYVDVRQVYGPTRSSAAIADAVTHIGTTNQVGLIFDPGSWVISSSVTIPSNFHVICPPGCVFSLNTSMTLTIQGTIQAGPYRIFTGAGTAVVSDLCVPMMRPEHWGTGTTADDAPYIQLFCTCVAASRTTPNTVNFTPGASYTLASGIDFQMWPGANIVAEGTKFTFSNNGKGFDLNPAFTAVMPVSDEADTYTIRNVHWRGGHFANTNATKTASYALRAYYFRGFFLSNARFGNNDADGFWKAVLIGGKDTYDIGECYFGRNINAVAVPATGTLYAHPGYGGNKLLDTRIHKCHFQTAVAETGIKVEDAVMNFSILDNTFAGATTTYPSIAHVHFLEGTAGAGGENVTVGVQIHNNKFEQMAATVATDTTQPAVWFDNTNSGDGFYSIDFNGNFYNAGGNRKGYVYLDNANGVRFGTEHFWPGFVVTSPKYGVHITSTCDDVQFDRSCTFRNFMKTWSITDAADSGAGLIRLTLDSGTEHHLFAGDRVYVYNVTGTVEANGMWTVQRVSGTQVDLVDSTFTLAYIAGGTLVHMNAITVGSTEARAKITMLPDVVPLTSPVHLNDWAAAACSDQTDTELNMSNQFDHFISTGSPAITRYLWPKGYFLSMAANDSASATNVVWASIQNAASSPTYARLRNNFSGTGNDNVRAVHGLVGANAAGNVYLSVEASGAGTLDLTIAVIGVVQ